MSMAKLFGRMRWGAVTAGWIAAALLTVSGPVSAGINDTRHNLGSAANGITGRNQASDTAEVCVFCHTPHGGSTSAPVPLWNKRLGAGSTPPGGGTYTTYASLNSPSIDGTITTVGSISVACLSCHDGSQAMDNIINAPGSGGVVANGGDGTNNGNDGRAFGWTGGTVNAAGALVSGASLIGLDISNDHPIGIQYCGGGLTGTGNALAGACRDTDFELPLTQLINGAQVFWIDTGGTGKQRTDLPLYLRDFGAGAGNGIGPSVECGSCHDPHVAAGDAGPAGTGRVGGATFLRISNASSAVCTACHVK